MGIAIGIDLGTTRSCVAVWKDGQVHIIPNKQNLRTTPSVVAFTHRGVLVGDEASFTVGKNSNNTIAGIKRLMGKEFHHERIQEIRHSHHYVIVDVNGKPHIAITRNNVTETFSPEEISTFILAEMKRMAEAYLQEAVTEAVVTVPAHFNNNERQATLDAAHMAGFKLAHVINEPTAAAIAYGLHGSKASKKVLVFDLGGGTFDVSLVEINSSAINVLNCGGDIFLGGEDFDLLLTEHFAKQFHRKHRKIIPATSHAFYRLYRSCEDAKCQLSVAEEAEICLDGLLDGIDFNVVATRDLFNRLCQEAFQKTLATVQKVLVQANLTPQEIDEVVMNGGSVRIPRIQEMVSEFFGGKRTNNSISPDESVACGAAIQAAMLSREMPEAPRLLVWEIIPLPLGVELRGGLMSVLVPRNTRLPHKSIATFTPSYDDQEALLIKVFEGESELTQDNTFLGNFRLTKLSSGKRSKPCIRIMFSIDTDGILLITAEETRTGNFNLLEIEKDWSLSRISASETTSQARDWQSKRQTVVPLIKAKNELSSYIHTLEKALSAMRSLRRHNAIKTTALTKAINKAKAGLRTPNNFTQHKINECQELLYEYALPVFTMAYEKTGDVNLLEPLNPGTFR